MTIINENKWFFWNFFRYLIYDNNSSTLRLMNKN